MFAFSAALLLPLFATPAFAEDVRRGGRAATHIRLSTTCLRENGDDCTFLDFYDTVELGSWMEARPTPSVRVRGEATLRFHPYVRAAVVEELAYPHIIHPVSIRLEEAIIDLFAVGGPNTDLRLGIQEVPWGLGEGLHVVDNVNPWDLEDPLSIDARLPVAAAWLHWHKGITSWEWVAVPVFSPSSLPSAGFDATPSTSDLTSNPAFDGIDVQDIELRVDVPDPEPANISLGTRIKLTTRALDLAVSGYHGRDSIPQGDGAMVLTGFQTDQGRVDMALPLVFPRVDILGVEARGELPWQMGAWFEVAEVFPSVTELTVSESQLQALANLGTIPEVPDPLPVVGTQDGAAFTRWVVGVEKMSGRVHAIAQWLHGFPTERQSADLRDYGAVVTRFTLTDTLILELQAISDGDGTIAQGSIELLHGDAAELEIGMAWANGSDNSTLAAFEGASHIHFGAETKF